MNPPRSAANVRDLVLQGPARYTREELALAASISVEEARRLWRAMGFADVGSARAFTDSDLTALLRVRSLVDTDVLDLDTAVEVARALGSTTSRLAEWQVDTLGRRLADRGLISSGEGLTAEDVGVVHATTASVLPVLEQIMVHVWRRQLAATLIRVLVTADPDSAEGVATGAATVGFADLVGFTRLSRQLEDDALARLVETFETVSGDVVASTGARLVKTLGDEVMFLADSAEQGAATALKLHRVHGADAEIPQLRVGIATGAVLGRMGDIFGPTVNLASRLTAIARPDSTLVDSATAEALQHRGYTLRQITPRPVRGVGLVRAYALSRRDHD